VIICSEKNGSRKYWRWLVKCENCAKERWVAQGARPETKTQHWCKSCAFKKSTQTPQAIEKRKQTCLKKFGFVNAFQSPKTKRTVKERFGVDNVFQHESVKEKIKQTTFAHYGVTCSLQSPVVYEKKRQTMIERYGVEFALQSDAIKKKIDFKAAWQKRHETLKRLGSYGSRTSKIEGLFYVELMTLFGAANVERFVLVNDWSIDFYVKSIDAYIQFDGVYWHGHNKTLDELRQSTSKRSHTIACHRENDERQNLWFRDNNLRLIRVTDEEFKNGKHLEKLNVNNDH
jgi:hypothetical protein